MTKLLTPDQTTFESETCGRCGGSGNYSFNQRDGTVCYGCGGQGVKLTKRGAAAQRFYNEMFKRPVESLKVGDVVKINGVTIGGNTTYTGYASVVELDLEPKVNGYSVINGVRKDSIYVSYTTEHSKLGRCGHSVPPGYIVTLRGSPEERAEAVAKAKAYQATLTKTGAPRQR